MTSTVETYLQQVLTKYRNPDTTKRDVLAATQLYRTLGPKMEPFVFNDGSQRNLLNLTGTIPVQYKGQTYNIPVTIWVLDNHPTSAPMCYVKPTNDMLVRVSKHVDQNGKIYLPYLHEWKQGSSDLLGAIQVMIIVFGEQPPVYAKPHASFASSNPAAMPQPMHGTQGSYPPYPSTTSATSSPYGYGAHPMPMPYSGASTNPPYPPVNNPSYPSYPQSYAPNYPQQPQPMPQPPVAAPNNTGTLSEDQIKASLLTAVDEKMKRRLREIGAQVQAEMDVLKRTQDDLNRGKMKLEDLINKLEHEQGELEKNISMLREKNETMKDVVVKLRNRDQLDVDEAVVTTAPLYRQLLNAYAEESATEDTIYYLSEALRKGVIDLDVFQKHVRELSRKQFMLRAVMLKCREKAGLL